MTQYRVDQRPYTNPTIKNPTYPVVNEHHSIREMEWPYFKEERDWREHSHYPTKQPCCICGSTHMIGMEPRFLYPICEEHSNIPPVEVSVRRIDGK
jgi:hypothetical protein